MSETTSEATREVNHWRGIAERRQKAHADLQEHNLFLLEKAMASDRKAETMLVRLLRIYLQEHSTGGSLHIVLDDGNYGDSSVEYCRDWAHSEGPDGDGDPLGYAIACELLLLSEAERQRVNEAAQPWKVDA